VRRVRICVDLPEDHYRAVKGEAERRGVEVEELVQQMMQNLLQELEREENEGADTPVIPS